MAKEKNNALVTKLHENVEQPFVVLQKNKKFYIGALGAIVSKVEFTSLAKAKEYIASKPYELIVNVAVLTIKQLEQYEKEQQELLALKTQKENETKSK